MLQRVRGMWWQGDGGDVRVLAMTSNAFSVALCDGGSKHSSFYILDYHISIITSATPLRKHNPR
jgi:hypothetical protein